MIGYQDVEIEVPKVIKPPVAMERPSKNEPFVQLQTTIADSLKQVSNDQSKESSDVISKQSGFKIISSIDFQFNNVLKNFYFHFNK